MMQTRASSLGKEQCLTWDGMTTCASGDLLQVTGQYGQPDYMLLEPKTQVQTAWETQVMEISRNQKIQSFQDLVTPGTWRWVVDQTSWGSGVLGVGPNYGHGLHFHALLPDLHRRRIISQM